jgi:hypothetical protein
LILAESGIIAPLQTTEEIQMNKFTLLALYTAISLSSFSNSGSAETPEKTIQGAWEVVVTLRFDAPNCKTAEIVPNGGGAVNPFPTFYTFHGDGTLSEFGSRAAPSHRTPGFGVWRKGDKSKINTRYTFLTFDENGIQDARLDIRGNLAVTDDGQSLKGTGRYVRTDISGNSIPFCATIAGERITF